MPTSRAAAEERSRRLRVTRDGAILTFALSAGAYEITLGGARPSVLTFLSGLLLSPLALRFDEARRNGNGKDRL